ncbi:NAD(+)/NADH kinase [Modestobacter sp. L9-4]|uniref:NAD(+)/NADH kinase n=1 Tax=Modestobacter sp. L9-4 TaxID=2851567 RepID=UPI001C76B5F4|nr:NAD(+)/NADH kinase [Modestobacter sp. L9-4]QXG76333.1 NAD(+)/NADH kinase [Modestobacter sp. L9-4]
MTAPQDGVDGTPAGNRRVVARIGLVVHEGKPVARAAAQRVRDWAAARDVPCVDIDVWSDSDARRPAHEEAALAGNPDLVVTVGGDGTFLRGARVAAAAGALVLGVDVGRVGFLTEVVVDRLEEALQAVVDGEVVIDARMMLTMRASRPLELPEGMDALLRYGRGPALPAPAVRPGSAQEVGWGVPLEVLALNDVVFEKLARDRQASLALYVDSRLFASYSADALVVSTATGSTAYSFAAGGPVLSPDLEALVFTPVAPHMVFDRSLVLSSRHRVGVRVLGRSGQVAVSVDGQLRGVLDPGDWVTVYGAAQRSELVRLDEPHFLDRVRSRFGLADARAAVADGDAPLVYDPGEPLPPDLQHPGPRAR